MDLEDLLNIIRQAAEPTTKAIGSRVNNALDNTGRVADNLKFFYGIDQPQTPTQRREDFVQSLPPAKRNPARQLQNYERGLGYQLPPETTPQEIDRIINNILSLPSPAQLGASTTAPSLQNSFR